jgi:hypothetical protein
MRLVLIGLAAMASAASAATPDPPAPLLGSWALDLAQSEIPPEARPNSVTITYTDVGTGKWNTTVKIVGSNGHKIDATATFPLDGTPAIGTGYPNVDMIAVKVPSPSVMVAAFYKEGMPRSTRTYIVSADGQTMSENIVWLNLNGKPEIATNRFNRIK